MKWNEIAPAAENGNIPAAGAIWYVWRSYEYSELILMFNKPFWDDLGCVMCWNAWVVYVCVFKSSYILIYLD